MRRVKRNVLFVLHNIHNIVCDNWIFYTKRNHCSTIHLLIITYIATFERSICLSSRCISSYWNWYIEYLSINFLEKLLPNLYIFDLNALGLRSNVAAIAFVRSSSCRTSLWQLRHAQFWQFNPLAKQSQYLRIEQKMIFNQSICSPTILDTLISCNYKAFVGIELVDDQWELF